VGYPRKSQTVTATPAKPGELSILLAKQVHCALGSVLSIDGLLVFPRASAGRGLEVHVNINQ
jgi:hypothetical protein